LLSRFTFNGTFINTTKTLRDFFLYSNYGLGLHTLIYFVKRFECWDSKKIGELPVSSNSFFLKSLYTIIPRKCTFKYYSILNIIFLDLTYSYNGWRHFNGLPVRGQRTWTNSKSALRSNLKLKEYKHKTSKIIYGKSQNIDLKVYTMAENINFLWFNQWHSEWLYGRDWLKRIFRRNPYNFKIDFVAIARGLLGNTKKESSKVGKKKKKLLVGYVGFDVGFTKLYAVYKKSLLKNKRKHRK
jgi:ribosomal protein S13